MSQTVVRNDKFSVYSNHDSEALDFSVFSTQYLKFDFDNSRCPASVKRAKKGFLNLVRVAEIEVLGFPQSTSTTATSTTGTATSTTNTDVAALHSRIDDLLSNQVNGDNVNGKVQAIEELIKGMQANGTPALNSAPHHTPLATAEWLVRSSIYADALNVDDATPSKGSANTPRHNHQIDARHNRWLAER